MVVAIYEKNEVGSGYGLFFIETDDFNTDIKEEKIYLNAILSAHEEDATYGFGGCDCSIMLHNIIEGHYGSTNVKELKPPCKIVSAVYIFCY